MTLIIAEAGVNHNGDESLAMALINAAHQAGADIVKFQTFNAKSLVTEDAKQAQYQVTNTQKVETQLSMLSRLELSYDAHLRLLRHCDDLGIEFMSTAFDFQSLDFLVQQLKLPRLKIASGELTNAPFVLAHARTGCELILSTGMSTLEEVQSALAVIAFGLISDADAAPCDAAFNAAFHSTEGQLALKANVTLLHCTTEYPAPFNEINLRAINTLADAFQLAVGYSDHSQGIAIPIAATALGANVIEKHFTLDNDLPGPDHKASLEPTELTRMIQAIRAVTLAQGDGIKQPQASELKNMTVARKSLVACKAIAKGQKFSSDNIAIMRPGTGMSPNNYWNLMKRSAEKDYAAGEVIYD